MLNVNWIKFVNLVVWILKVDLFFLVVLFFSVLSKWPFLSIFNDVDIRTPKRSNILIKSLLLKVFLLP